MIEQFPRLRSVVAALGEYLQSSMLNGSRELDVGTDAVRLAQLVDARCVNPAGGAITDPDRIVLVPAGASIADGFARARRALRNDETVRILGCGVTYPDAWPPWPLHRWSRFARVQRATLPCCTASPYGVKPFG